VLLAIAAFLVGLLLLLVAYALLRVLSKAIFKSYFEAKEDNSGKRDKKEGS